MAKPAKNTVCLWYERGAEDAAKFYAATFPDSSVGQVHRAPSDFPSGKQGDALTVEFQLEKVNPIFLQHLDALWMMSKSWSEKNRVTKPLDFKNKEESHASLNANGTGPFSIESHQPGVKTVFKANPNWWRKPEHNLKEIIFTPIGSDATRVAALLSGEVDVIELGLHLLEGLRADAGQAQFPLASRQLQP